MKEIKCQLCVKDVFIYRTVSWAPIPYKNLRYRLDTMTYSTLQINIKQWHALYFTTISPQNATILSWADQVKRSILSPNVGKNSFSKPPLKFKTANSCYPYLVLSSRKHTQILSYGNNADFFCQLIQKNPAEWMSHCLTFRDTAFWLKKFLDLRLEQAWPEHYSEHYFPKKKRFFKGFLKTDVTFGSFAYLYQFLNFDFHSFGQFILWSQRAIVLVTKCVFKLIFAPS